MGKETVGDLKARERKGVALGKDKYILSCARFAATVTLRARLQKITVCNELNSKFDKKKRGYKCSKFRISDTMYI